MFQPALFGTALTVEHQHSDGTWHPMELEEEPLDPSERDPEKGWLRGQVYRCTSCPERVRIAAPVDEPVARGAAPPIQTAEEA
jgi:hypothetical protein